MVHEKSGQNYAFSSVLARFLRAEGNMPVRITELDDSAKTSTISHNLFHPAPQIHYICILMEKQTLIQKLIDRDERVTRMVFYSTEPGMSCRALLCKKLVDFDYVPPELFYDLLVSDLYAIFMNLNKEGKEMGDAKNLRAIKNPEALFGWIEMTVVRHLQALRKKGIRFGNLLLENGEVNPHISKDRLAEDASKTDYRRDFERLLRLMPNRAHAQILRMSILEDMPIKEIARALGITEGAVNMRKKRAMKELTELLAKDIDKYHGKS